MKKVKFEPVERKDYSDGMNSILDLYNLGEKEDWVQQGMERLKVSESIDILEKYGQYYEVTRGKIDRRKQKLGSCYKNSFRMMEKGYKYVEGVVQRKSGGELISHSWNVYEDGIHYDFTYDNPENYKYLGIILEEDIVNKVGLNNGGIFYCVLPFIKVK